MDAFQKFGFSEKEADIIQDVLLTSDLYGIAGYYAKMACKEVLMGFSFTNSETIVPLLRKMFLREIIKNNIFRLLKNNGAQPIWLSPNMFSISKNEFAVNSF